MQILETFRKVERFLANFRLFRTILDAFSMHFVRSGQCGSSVCAVRPNSCNSKLHILWLSTVRGLLSGGESQTAGALIGVRPN